MALYVPYRYLAKIIYIHEGNIYDAVVDLGGHISARWRLKLEGLELPSLRSPSEADRSLAKGAKSCAMQVLLNRKVMIETIKDSSFPVGFLAFIYLDEASVASSAYTVVDGEEVLDFGKYMWWLFDRNFDQSKVDVKPCLVHSA